LLSFFFSFLLGPGHSLQRIICPFSFGTLHIGLVKDCYSCFFVELSFRGSLPLAMDKKMGFMCQIVCRRKRSLASSFLACAL
jgi:hypothetical protein